MRVLVVRDGIAVAERHGIREEINAMLLPDVAAGAWILAFQGQAMRELTEREAIDTDQALAALGAVLSGETDVSAYFSDLVDREPQLPPHLSKTTP
jgi:hydrogenase assembly chaperone HypC/HupF